MLLTPLPKNQRDAVLLEAFDGAFYLFWGAFDALSLVTANWAYRKDRDTPSHCHTQQGKVKRKETASKPGERWGNCLGRIHNVSLRKGGVGRALALAMGFCFHCFSRGHPHSIVHEPRLSISSSQEPVVEGPGMEERLTCLGKLEDERSS